MTSTWAIRPESDLYWYLFLLLPCLLLPPLWSVWRIDVMKLDVSFRMAGEAYIGSREIPRHAFSSVRPLEIYSVF